MTEDSTVQRRSSWLSLAMLFTVFAAIGLVVYREALLGPFIGDDGPYITHNPYMRAPWRLLLGELFNPVGDLRIYMTGNFAPVHALAHVIEWRFWGNETAGYHIVNVLLHALNATLLVALLQGSKLPRSAAIVLGALFLLHPANVEAVAWISQLKSVLALNFSLAALLAFRRYPLSSTALFACALFSKATAVFALAMAAAFLWAWRGQRHSSTRHGIGLALWAAVFIAYAPAQFSAFASVGQAYSTPYADAFIQLRSMVAIGARYLLMAATGHGTSAFHEPEPVHSSMDPWWIAGLAVAPVLVWRISVSLRDRREEAAWWIGAAVAFGPVSQIVPFYFGMGDRYLYFVLPGLLGGTLLACRRWLASVTQAQEPNAPTRSLAFALPRAALVGGFLLIALFAHQAQTRATLWQSMDYLDRDAIRNYPNGANALYIGAIDAVKMGDHGRAIELLRVAADRGHFFIQPFRSRHFKPLARDQRYKDLMYEIAGRRIVFAYERDFQTQHQLMSIAQSHKLRHEFDEALKCLQRAAQKPGPYREKIFERMVKIREARDRHRAKSEN